MSDKGSASTQSTHVYRKTRPQTCPFRSTERLLHCLRLALALLGGQELWNPRRQALPTVFTQPGTTNSWSFSYELNQDITGEIVFIVVVVATITIIIVIITIIIVISITINLTCGAARGQANHPLCARRHDMAGSDAALHHANTPPRCRDIMPAHVRWRNNREEKYHFMPRWWNRHSGRQD